MIKNQTVKQKQSRVKRLDRQIKAELKKIEKTADDFPEPLKQMFLEFTDLTIELEGNNLSTNNP